MGLGSLYPDMFIYGPPGAGKSEVANFLTGLGYARRSFAGTHKGGVRDIAIRMFGERVRDDREVLIWLGQGGRAIDEDVWVRNLLRELERIPDSQPVVVDDLRADNEWWALRARGFVAVRIDADADLRRHRLQLNGKGDSLPGPGTLEGLLEDRSVYEPDHTIINNGTVRQLEARLTALLNHERRRLA